MATLYLMKYILYYIYLHLIQQANIEGKRGSGHISWLKLLSGVAIRREGGVERNFDFNTGEEEN